VLVANTPMDTDKIKMYGARVKTDSMAKVADIEAAERNKMKTNCEQIIAQGINVFINRQLIYNYPEQIFTDAGVMSIEHAGACSFPNPLSHFFSHTMQHSAAQTCELRDLSLWGAIQSF
jgi:chaperonin GroEL (HSP60 family)